MSTPPKRLRIGIPSHVTSIPRGTGHGNVWGHLLRELRSRAEIVTAESLHPDSIVDVWLADGHHGPPLAVSAPVVVAVHEAGWHTDFLRSLLEPAFLEVIDRQTGDCCRAAAAVITPSESSRDQVMELYGLRSDKVHVVPYGVDQSLFRPGLEGGSNLVAEAGGDRARPYILCVGQLHPRKNFAAVRETVDQLRLEGLPHQLVIVPGAPADGTDESQSRSAALAPLPRSGEPVISIAQPTDEQLAVLMASAAVLCQPSFMEGFGMPVLEAMACGIPVVVSDRGSLPEVAGRTGVIVPPTADAFREALGKLLRDPPQASALAEAGHRRATGFTWGKTASGWLHVLESVQRPNAFASV